MPWWAFLINPNRFDPNRMIHDPFNLILLGDPASGKGTQAGRLAKKYNLYNFDMGHEVRKAAAREKFDYAKTTAIGKLTPTAVVRDILHRVIRVAPPQKGILFNGHPKMIGEARLAAKWLRQYKRSDPIVIYLHIPAVETLRRARKRVVKINGRLVKRDDDSERALVNRRKYYHDQVSRVVIFFKKKYRFKKISGLGSEAVVARRIAKVIEREIRSDLGGHGLRK
jgi:adenylate kinase